MSGQVRDGEGEECECEGRWERARTPVVNALPQPVCDVRDDPLVLLTGLHSAGVPSGLGLVGSTLADVDPHHQAHQNNFLLFRAFASPVRRATVTAFTIAHSPCFCPGAPCRTTASSLSVTCAAQH